jgi:ERCC4-type nuclease
MSIATIVIDNRERWINIDDLTSVISLPCSSESLELGDFVIQMDDTPHTLIERKTVNDLAQSIKDGRYKDQLARYKSAIKSQNVNVLYIIEGVNNLRDLLMNPYSTNKSLHSACTNIMFRDRIPIIFCKTQADTKNFLIDLAQKIQKNPEKYKPIAPEEEIENNCVLRNTKKHGDLTPERILANMMACIPGVSLQTALDLMVLYDVPMNMEELVERIRLDSSKAYTLKTKTGRKVSKSVIASILHTITHIHEPST